MYRYCRSLAVAMLLIAAGCSGGPSAPAATATPEGPLNRLALETPGGAAPPQQPTPPCQRRELEDWLQRSGSLVFEYAQEMNNHLATPPEQMGAVIEQLDTLRGALQDITPPPCAVDHYDMIMGMMLDAIDALTAYARGNGTDLISVATQSNAALDHIRIREEQLAAVYDSLPRE